MNIFVASISFNTTESELRDEFERFGAVDSLKIITDRQTGKSKGFGFVEMPDDDDAIEAINDLNESEIDGRQIVVKEAKPRK